MYNGYLIKVGTYVIPHKYIQAESYKVTRNSQDLDSYRDANGYLHREALDNFVPKVEFNVRPMLTNTEFALLMENIRSQYINEVERRVVAEVFVPEVNDYVTQDMYLSDFTPEMYFADSMKIIYKTFRMAFIGYGVAIDSVEEGE